MMMSTVVQYRGIAFSKAGSAWLAGYCEKNVKRTKGRPQGSQARNLSDSLLSAAEKKLHEKSHLDLTSQEIATNAGTYAGMVNYYFQGKEGLLSALVDTVIDDINRHMEEIEAGIDEGVADPTDVIVRGLIAGYYPHAAVASVVLIEIFRPESPIRQFYKQRRGSIFVRLELLIRKLVAKGIYRPDIDAAAATWTLLSLVVGPLMLMPIWQVSDATSTAPQMSAWADHVAGLLRREFVNFDH